MLTAIGSIIVITAFVWLAQKMVPLGICPICAGVSGTWIWLLAARFAGFAPDPTVIALLMGGTVVGIAYTLEKHMPTTRSPLLWKTIFIPLGFGAMFALLNYAWWVFTALVVILGIVVYVFLRFKKSASHKDNDRTTSELEEKMKNCC
jgi:hypothetical protein